jgi:hypothetical protein
MGTEAIIASIIAGAVLSTVGTVVQAQSQKRAAAKAQRAKEEELKYRKEADAINQAAQRNEEARNRRKSVREHRVRVSQIQQQAENAGVAGSSGESGASSALTTNLGQVVSGSASRTKAIQGISEANSNAATASVNAQNALNNAGSVFGSVATAMGQLTMEVASSGAFGAGPKAPGTSGNFGR